ncbi:MAG: METTL5 family protein [Candidatus Thermoplasmatota archaeon]|nr:METTL5 family protein [Candidatus Thermoplasmatota archaeon]
MADQGARVRRKTIERTLSQVPDHPSPDPKYEQIKTPAPIATDVVFEAFHLGDIGGKIVLDFGCGTGILAIGAGLLGAMPVHGFDIDEEAIELAREAARKAGVSQAEFEVLDVSEMGEYEADTILSNPPFGAQKKHADRPFLEAANAAGQVAYTFHMAPTIPWVTERIGEMGGQVTHQFPFHFPLKAQFFFHEKPSQDINVVVLRWTTAQHASNR